MCSEKLSWILIVADVKLLVAKRCWGEYIRRWYVPSSRMPNANWISMLFFFFFLGGGGCLSGSSTSAGAGTRLATDRELRNRWIPVVCWFYMEFCNYLGTSNSLFLLYRLYFILTCFHSKAADKLCCKSCDEYFCWNFESAKEFHTEIRTSAKSMTAKIDARCQDLLMSDSDPLAATLCNYCP